MALFRNNTQRLHTKFHKSLVSRVLPEFFEEDYKNLATFLKKYYEFTGEDSSISFEDKIHSLFNVRDISSTDIEHLDYLLEEIGNGLTSDTFAANPRLMAKLIGAFFRAKGTQISAEQFFRSFYNEDVEIVFPKRNIFILNQSFIGPNSLKFIQDNKRYQIFSILIKTGISLADYESLYKKFVHPAGFYVAADVVTQANADIGIQPGLPIDPLERPNYPIVIGNSVDLDIESQYVLLTMRETDPVDSEIIISSVPLVSTYGEQTLEGLIAQGYPTIASLVDLNTPATIDAGLNASSNIQTLDEDYFN